MRKLRYVVDWNKPWLLLAIESLFYYVPKNSTISLQNVSIQDSSLLNLISMNVRREWLSDYEYVESSNEMT